MSKLSELSGMMAGLKKEIQEKGQEALKEAFTKFFQENPDIEGVRWEQYTPYFMDGDPCEFGVNDFRFKMKNLALENEDFEDEFLYPWGYKSQNEAVKEAMKEEEFEKPARAVRSFCKDVTSLDEIFLASFGDHCKVTATRSGFEVEEYEHD